ncbi:P-loop NTPase fold protein [Chloroflexota bacterium]
MKNWLKSLFQSRKEDKSFTTNTTKPNTFDENSEISPDEIYYVSDRPVSDPNSEDELKRWPFAQRVAQTIASSKDPSSIVIGICGVWGEGKTSVLNFIDKELENSSTVVCVKFNPWRFTDEVHLLRYFFQTLADALGKSEFSKKEEIGKALQKYGGILSSLSVNVAGLQLSPGKVASELGKNLSFSQLSDTRDRIEKILKSEGKRIVILMDDIDRLDRTEVQTIFKLLKLSADFSNTAYLLAYDPVMVAASLGEKYSSGDKEAGFQFLEKIVQIPLNIPIADQLSLRKICLEVVDQALKGAEIELSQEQVQAFVRHFTVGLEVRLKTPRIGKLYANALAFSLPILKNEVHPVDLMLIEGIRIFYPKLYAAIKNNPEVFLGTIMDSPNKEQAKQRSLVKINEGLIGLKEDETEAAKDLLQELFPRLKAVLGNTSYGPDWDETWAKQQRISSKHYFGRYFSYAVPEGDISDQELEYLIQKIDTEPVSVIATDIQKLVGDRNADVFILKLRQKVKEFPSGISQNLALALGEVGDMFPRSETLSSFATAFSQAGILIHQLIDNIPKAEGRFNTAKELIQKGEPLSFSVECFTWLRTSEEKEEQDRTLSHEEEDELGKIIVERIKALSSNQPIYKQFPGDANTWLQLWSIYGSEGETQQYLSKIFIDNPYEALEFAKCYLPTSWGLGSGLSHKGNFGRFQYDSMVKVVDTDVIYDALYKIYGAALDDPDYYKLNEYPLDERVAHQFAFIHAKVKAKQQDGDQKAESKEQT